MKGQRDEDDGKILLGDNAAAHQFRWSWESGFQLVSLLCKYCRPYVHVYSNATCAKSYLHQTFPNVTYCANRLVSVNNICIQTRVRPFKHGNTAHTLVRSSRSVMKLGTCKCKPSILPMQAFYFARLFHADASEPCYTVL
jgi:hypothetical protein